MQQHRIRTASWISAVALMAASVPFALAQQGSGVEQQVDADSAVASSVGDENANPGEFRIRVGPNATIERLPRANSTVVEMYARGVDPQVDLRALFRGNTKQIKHMDAAETAGGIWLLRAALRPSDDGKVKDLDVSLEGNEFVFRVVDAKPLPTRGREPAPTLAQLIAGELPEVQPAPPPVSHFKVLPGDAIAHRMEAWDYDYSLTRNPDAVVGASWERIDASRRSMLRARPGTTVHQEYMFYLGYNYLSMGFGREARYYFSQMSARPGPIPQHEIALARARAELACGNFDEARQWFYEAHALGGHEDSILEGLAVVSLETGSPPRAPTARLIWATTSASSPLLLAAELLQIDKRIAESRRVLESIKPETLTPEQRQHRALRLGDACFHDHDAQPEDAELAWAEADPAMARTREILRELHQAPMGERGPLIPSLVQLTMQRSDAGAEALYLLSQVDARLKLKEDAINDLALLLRRYPKKAAGSDVPEEFWRIYSEYIEQLAEKDRHLKIAELHESVWSPTVRRAVRAPGALVHVAEAYEEVGLPGRAVVVLRDAVQVLIDANIDDVELLYRLAELYASVGEGVDRLPDGQASFASTSFDENDSPAVVQDRVWVAGLDTLAYLRSQEQDVIPTAKIDLLEARLELGRGNDDAAAAALARAARDADFRDVATLKLALLDARRDECRTAVPALRRLAASETAQPLMDDSRPWLALARCEMAGGNVDAAAQAARTAAGLAEARLAEITPEGAETDEGEIQVEVPPEMQLPEERVATTDDEAEDRLDLNDIRGLTAKAKRRSDRLQGELRSILEAELQYAVALASVAENWEDPKLTEQLEKRGGVWSSMAEAKRDDDVFKEQVDARMAIPWDGL